MGVNADLYALDEKLAEYVARVESQGGEETDEDRVLFESLAQDAGRLVEGCAKWQRNAEARAERYKALAKPYEDEAKRLKALARVDEGVATHAGKLACVVLEKLGMKSLRTEIGTATACLAAQPKITFEGESPPEGFRREKTEWVLDRDAVLQAEQHGCLPAGIKVERTPYLRLSAAKERKAENAE